MKNLLGKICIATFLFTLLFSVNKLNAKTEKDIVYAPDFQAAPGYDFRETKWGMSPDEVKAVEMLVVGEEKQLSSNDTSSTYISYPEVGFFDIFSHLAYLFDDNQLVGGVYLFFQPVDIYQELIRTCEKHYGPSDSIRIDKEDNTVYMLWDLPKSKMALVSCPFNVAENLYEYKIEFFYPKAKNYDFADIFNSQDYKPEFRAGPQYNFRKTRWLMTMDEVLASEETKPMEKGLVDYDEVKAKYIAYPETMVFGYPAMPGYTFLEDKLIIGTYFFDSANDIEKDLLSKCEAQFGQYNYANIKKSNEEKQYTWDLGKTIFTYSIEPHKIDFGKRKYRFTFYYRVQLREIPPN